MVSYCFAFKDEKDQDLFYKALVERKESLQRKSKPKIHQQQVFEKKELQDTRLQLEALPVESFSIYVKDAQSIKSKKDVNAINCFQDDPDIKRTTNSSDVCAISGNFFVRASGENLLGLNKFKTLKSRLTALLSSDQKSIQSAPEECKNHCFDFRKCSNLRLFYNDKKLKETKFEFGLKFMGPKRIESQEPDVEHTFYFGSEKERDYAKRLLQEIIDKSN